MDNTNVSMLILE